MGQGKSLGKDAVPTGALEDEFPPEHALNDIPEAAFVPLHPSVFGRGPLREGVQV